MKIEMKICEEEGWLLPVSNYLWRLSSAVFLNEIDLPGPPYKC